MEDSIFLLHRHDPIMLVTLAHQAQSLELIDITWARPCQQLRQGRGESAQVEVAETRGRSSLEETLAFKVARLGGLSCGACDLM